MSGINCREYQLGVCGNDCTVKREGNPFGGGCAMQIVLDGILLPANFNLELLPHLNSCLYRMCTAARQTVPAQFGGVTAMWPDRILDSRRIY